MSYFEVYERSPEEFFLVLLCDFILTVIMYALFPLLFSALRKKTITEKKYSRICYFINSIPMLFFGFVNGSLRFIPFMLWTSLFVSLGKKSLRKKGAMIDPEDIDEQMVPEKKPVTVELSSIQTQIARRPDDLSYIGKFQKETPSPPKAKQRYCRHCGGIVNPETKKCDSCGKQYFRLKINWGATFAVTVTLLAVAIAGVSLYRINESQSKIAQLTDQQAQLQAKVDELESSVYDKNVQITKLKKQLEDKNFDYNRLSKEKAELEDKVNFYDHHIVFILDDGTNLYHYFDCIVFKYSDEDFWAYNVESARSRGYKSCWVCDYLS